jgi:hypothetical protein
VALGAGEFARRGVQVGCEDLTHLPGVEPTRSMNITVSWRRSAIEPVALTGAAAGGVLRG